MHQKEIINIIDGKRLGYPSDVRFDLCDGRITAIIVSGGGFLGIVGKQSEAVIPWENIERIGQDIILVKYFPAKPEPEPTDKKKKLFS